MQQHSHNNARNFRFTLNSEKEYKVKKEQGKAEVDENLWLLFSAQTSAKESINTGGLAKV